MGNYHREIDKPEELVDIIAITNSLEYFSVVSISFRIAFVGRVAIVCFTQHSQNRL